MTYQYGYWLNSVLFLANNHIFSTYCLSLCHILANDCIFVTHDPLHLHISLRYQSQFFISFSKCLQSQNYCCNFATWLWAYHSCNRLETMGTYINKGNNVFRDIVSHEYVDKTSLIPLINSTLNSERRYSCVLMVCLKGFSPSPIQRTSCWRLSRRRSMWYCSTWIQLLFWFTKSVGDKPYSARKQSRK